MESFDDTARTTILDQEKSTESACKDVFQNAKLFLNPMHLLKTIGSPLGSHLAIGLSLYDQALHAPAKAAGDEIVARFSETQAIDL